MTECLVDTFQYCPLISAEQSFRRISAANTISVILFLTSRSKYLSDVVGHFLGLLNNPLRTGLSADLVQLPMSKP